MFSRKLTQINVYPVKSLDGYSPAEAVVEKRGLAFDRRWLIVDTEGVFQTQRTNGKMALLKAHIENEHLVIAEKNNPNNSIRLSIDAKGDTRDVLIWDDTVLAQLVSPAADAFLSDFLGKKMQLVKMPDSTERRVEASYNRGEDIVSFADGYPFLILGEASMRDLSMRLGSEHAEINERRFRANFIFSNEIAYEEDEFKQFSIGNVPFEGIKNCARCVLITRNPDTGEKGKEPLATLQDYRQRGTKTLFAQNVVWQHQLWSEASQPVVRVGDPIVLP